MTTFTYTRGTCPTCHASITINREGLLRSHKSRDVDGVIVSNTWCKSCGRLPVEAGGAPIDCGSCGVRLLARGPHDCEVGP